MLVTLKSLSTFTVTMLPSVLRTCASYGEPAESVSTLMIVPPGTAASAAALTLLAVPSVSSASLGPWATVDGSALPFAAATVVDDVELDDPPCAPAMCEPARIAPATNPLATSPTGAIHLRREDLVSRPISLFSISSSFFLRRPFRRLVPMVEEAVVIRVRFTCEPTGKRRVSMRPVAPWNVFVA